MPRRTTPASGETQTAEQENAVDLQAPATADTHSDAPEPVAAPERDRTAASPMKIDVRITSTRNVFDDPVRATATVTLNDALVIKGVRVVKGENGLFCSMPARRLKSGDYSEVCHPITRDFALQFNASVLNEYQLHLHQQMEESMQMPHIYEPEVDVSRRELNEAVRGGPEEQGSVTNALDPQVEGRNEAGFATTEMEMM